MRLGRATPPGNPAVERHPRESRRPPYEDACMARQFQPLRWHLIQQKPGTKDGIAPRALPAWTPPDVIEPATEPLPYGLAAFAESAQLQRCLGPRTVACPASADQDAPATHGSSMKAFSSAIVAASTTGNACQQRLPRAEDPSSMKIRFSLQFGSFPRMLPRLIPCVGCSRQRTKELAAT